MTTKTYKLSVSTGFIDKNPIKDKLAYKQGFIPVEFTLEEIAEIINKGMTFSYQFLNETRKAQNFLATDILAVDIDHGMNLSEAQENPIVQQYCSLLYTTPSHTPEDHRFRLIFALPRTITEPKELQAATRALAQRLGGDRAATDAARMFHGSKGSEPLIFDNEITPDFLAELIEDGLTIPTTDSIEYENNATCRSDLRVDKKRLVKTHDGQQVEVGSIQSKTSIYCPFHQDKNPSAFIGKTEKRSTFIHCSKCHKTWWVERDSLPKIDFDAFDKVVRNVRLGHLNKDQNIPLWDLIQQPELLSLDNIHITEGRYLDIKEIKDGITFIKSPKGSGKTTFLARALKSITQRYATLEEYEEDTDFETEAPFTSDDRILLIGHRVALIGELCKRLHLNHYNDDKKLSSYAKEASKNRFGVCLDSLWRVRDRTYDIIVIDEVEQVLAHFFSGTIGEKRYGIFEIFSNLLRKAKKIVVLDADLGWITFNTLTNLIGFESRETSIHTSSDSRKIPIEIYINDWKVKNREILIYPNISQLVEQVRRDVILGKRIFICSNSKRKIKALDKSILELEEEVNRPIPRIMITSENSEKGDIQEFIKNIAKDCLKYQVILSSPSLGTGIDISFENDGQEIDAVYGFFENQVNTHFEIDQQLARVRNPKDVHVWVSPACFNFETEFGVVQQDFLRRFLLDGISDGFTPVRADIGGSRLSPIIEMAAMVISQQRASKNFLRSNFIKYRKSQGWIIQEIPLDEELRKSGQRFFKTGKDLENDEMIQTLCNAPVMNRIEFETFEEVLDGGDVRLSPEQWFSFYRTRLELFYRERITPELILRDKEGKYRRSVFLYESVMSIGDMPYKDHPGLAKRGGKKVGGIHDKLFTDKTTQSILIHGLLSTTPIFKGGVFDTTVEFTKDQLGKFIKASIKLKPIVETQLGINTQRDIHEKPTQHLNKILGAIGLKHKEIKKKNAKGGDRTYIYQIDAGGIQMMEDIIRRREIIKGWEFIDQTYGFTYPKELEDEEFFFNKPNRSSLFSGRKKNAQI